MACSNEKILTVSALDGILQQLKSLPYYYVLFLNFYGYCSVGHNKRHISEPARHNFFLTKKGLVERRICIHMVEDTNIINQKKKQTNEKLRQTYIKKKTNTKTYKKKPNSQETKQMRVTIKYTKRKKTKLTYLQKKNGN